MFQLPPVLYRGSVKNIRGEVSADVLLFEYSDRFSVFDWGEMPDQLTDKGRALSVMGKYFFLYLENPKSWSDLFERESITKRFDSTYLNELKNTVVYKQWCESGIAHHALLNNSDEVPFNSNLMNVKKIDVLRPALINQSYDYSPYLKKPVNALVPLEIIFRLGLPPGNSLSKRLGNNPVLWKEFGFESVPDSGAILKNPVLDFSTKLERGDRYLDYSEARSIAGLSQDEWSELQQMTHLIALNLYSLHESMGLNLLDGKIEMAFSEDESGKRTFMLVDSIGIDELRLQTNGKSFSKEFLREFYKETKWYNDLEAAKLESKMTGKDFKILCQEKFHSTPAPLPAEILERALFVYKSYSNALAAKMNATLPFDSEFSLQNYRERYL
jgi:phosphoribosylaminoimidazole-succinocarboxamide synthase